MKYTFYLKAAKRAPGMGLLIFFLLATQIGIAQADAFGELLNTYSQNGAGPFSAEQGKRFWSEQRTNPGTGTTQSCSSCHTENLAQAGKHRKTGKRIKPMAPSVNPQRLSDSKKIKKWLRRNCKSVLGRTCTDQEKGDVLSFIHEFN